MEFSNRVKQLLSEMTIEEKAGQLTQLAGVYFSSASKKEDMTGPMLELGLTEDMAAHAGSVLSVFDMDDIERIQREHMEKDRLGIPLMFMADIVHGYKTIFPIPLAMSCSWDEKLVEKAAELSALEASAGGQHVTFSPMADLIRDSRWGRVMEATGEDPYLNSVYARAFVRGYQGKDVKEKGKLAACAKHFIGYGQGEAGREYNTVDISDGILWEFCMPSFQAALEEGCLLVMSSFNTMFRIPVTGNKKVLKEILRQQLGFDGVVISDWGAVNELINHSIAANGEEACKAAFKATVDIEMMSAHYMNHIPKLVQDGYITMEELDEAAGRVLALKERLGLFENPYKDLNRETAQSLFLCKEHRRFALEAAEKSMVLLQNKRQVLPMKKGGRVCLTGPFSNAHEMLGGWHTLGENKDCVTLYDGLKERLEKDILFVPWNEENIEGTLQEAVQACAEADYIIAALGESQDDTGESTSRAELAIQREQIRLLKELKKLGKKVITVIFSGRALELRQVCRYSDAVVQAWYLGVESGNALAEVLVGNCEPTGRLTISFPYKTGQMPLYYNAYQTGRPKIYEENQERYVSKYIDCPNQALFPFGFGLGYTKFRYDGLHLSREITDMSEPLKASVRVKNTGKRRGTEIVQMYLRDVSASVVRPVRELRGFQKIVLEEGEEREISFFITKEDLKFYDIKLERIVEEGEFEVMIGSNSRDYLKESFYYKERHYAAD